MSAQGFLFTVFAAITVVAALRVVTARNPVHSALWLVLTFFTSAALWMLLQAEFLAITLVLVYVGAVMVLFLFVVMMLDVNIDQMRHGFWRNLPVGLVVGILIIFELAAVIWFAFRSEKLADVPALPEGYSNTKALGNLLYTDYVYPFEIAAVLLLVAIIAAIALTLRTRKDTKTNDPSVAVRTRAEDRLKVIKMPAVPRDRSSGAGGDQADDAAPAEGQS